MDVLDKMLGYVKFMKSSITKKRTPSFELEDNLHHCSIIVLRSLALMNKDLGAFTIICIVDTFKFARCYGISVLALI